MFFFFFCKLLDVFLYLCDVLCSLFRVLRHFFFSYYKLTKENFNSTENKRFLEIAEMLLTHFLWERFEPFIDVTLYCQINSERFVYVLFCISINFYSSQRQLLDQLPTQNSAPSNFTLTSTIQHRTNYSQWSSLLYLEIRGLRRTISVIMSSNIYLSMLNSLWFESED